MQIYPIMFSAELQQMHFILSNTWQDVIQIHSDIIVKMFLNFFRTENGQPVLSGKLTFCAPS